MICKGHGKGYGCPQELCSLQANFTVEPRSCLYMCVCRACVCTCVRMVTASEMVMHHVLIVLTLTFIQGHTDLNREHYKCLIISETVEAIPIMSAVNLFSVR